MKCSPPSSLALWIVQIALAALFLLAGLLELAMPGNDPARRIGLPALFLLLIRVSDVAGGLGPVLPGWPGMRRALTPMAASDLILLMAGAVVISAVRVSIAAAALPFVVGLLLATVVRGRR